MNMKNTLPISEARKRIFDIAEDVQKPNTYYTITEKGRPKAVVISAEEFESWQETLEVIKDFPDLDRDLREVKNDVKTGKYRKYTSLENILLARGYVQTGRTGKNHEISSSPKTQRRKRTKKTA